MIKLLLISCLAGAADDKNLHVGLSYNITALTSHITRNSLIAAAVGASIGATKEFVLDQHPDAADLSADLLGVAIATIVPFRIEF